MLSQDDYLDALDRLDELDLVARRYDGLAEGEADPLGDVMFTFARQALVDERTELEIAVRAYQRRHPLAPTTRNP